jgi:hypothetical protein
MKIDIIDINKAIDKEMEYAKQVNPIMALGMSQIKRILNEINDKLESGTNNINV